MPPQVTVVSAIVTSQCCTTQQRGLVGLAPLHTIRLAKQNERTQAALTSEPPFVDDVPYDVNRFLVEAHPSMALSGDRQMVAHLLESVILSAGPDPEWLVSRRTARMTPEARRLLRGKVQLFWARPEEADAAHLVAAGLPVGF